MEENNHNEDPGTNSGFFQKAGRKNVFQTPPDYFEKLPLEIASRKQQVESVNGYRKWIPLHIATATVCLLLLVAAGILFFKFPQGKENATAEFSYEDLNNSGMITEIDESILMDVLATGNSEEAVHDKSGQDIQQLHDYLIENDTDINLIISEL